MEKWLNSWSLGLNANVNDFTRIKKAGFEGIEILAEQNNAHHYLKFASDLGFKVGLHLPFHDLNLATPDSIVYERTFNVLSQWLAKLAEYGGKHATFHGGYAWFSEERNESLIRVKERILKLNEVAMQHGVELLLENLIPDKLNYCHQIASNVEEWIDLITAANVKACLDIGHLDLMGDALETTIDQLAGSLGGIHLSENDGKSDLHLLPGEGNHFTEGLEGFLEKQFFDGPVIYEINPYQYSIQDIINHVSNVNSIVR
ncbi:sugar phosphate isomerase/epimerase [Fictibacillus sp. WQ 8-8]|uniref:sugar phosphate isomerase/epimerase family protein n=1 Tax=unclassified Fictibacillus TaxID=2644029 RepID=UPI0007854525|nr:MULTISPECIES: sugar phosphate isomerase/epimerase family protein [unclassified Fictibacillus]MCQ6265966.1 sugar phosphate isomerase/epimerase [Fictibacillus sp. WQ 8-8]MED2972817.1 sugar phosphate isomerase/epimerase [Fictibacillus sp. B-59209]